jgi:diguanylate cyclase (GGDEF)-like protein/PAS domain S-box-containing protein
MTPVALVDAPAAMAASVDRMRAALQATLDSVEEGIIMVDPHGRVVVANRSIAGMLDLPPEVLAGNPTMDSIIAFQQQRGDFARACPSQRRWLDGSRNVPSPDNYERATADGRLLEVRTRRLPDGGYVRTYADVTEQRAAERSIRAAEADYRGLFENAVIGIYRSTPDGRQLRANRALVALNGYESEAEMLASVNDIASEWYVDPARRAEFKRLMERDGQVTDFVSEIYRHKSRDRIWISENAWAVRGADGSVAYYEGTVQDASARVQAERRIDYLAHHDTLTGLPNRILVTSALEQAVAEAGHGQSVAVLCLDLDRFKEVNDTLGHAAGDQLLQQAAVRLRAVLGPNDLAARLGGDEFAVILRNVLGQGSVRQAAQAIVRSLSRPYNVAGQRVVVGVSIGIALAPGDADNPNELLRNADIALYRAKAEGRGTHRFFESAMDARVQFRRTIETDLRRALAFGQLDIHYQPIFDLGERRVSTLEALLRWRHPTRGSISPVDFIPVAEETGLIVPIGEWALREATAAVARLPGDVALAVNLSPAQFRSRSLLATIVNALATSRLPAHRLELEITETLLMLEDADTHRAMEDIRALGVKLALDDFGIGYSSLSYLQRFRFDKIKIDRSFIQKAAGDDASAAIVRAIIGLGRDLGIVVVAEGVETTAQIRALQAQGCRWVQGWALGKATDIAGVDPAIRRLEGRPAWRASA